MHHREKQTERLKNYRMLMAFVVRRMKDKGKKA
jgi:hypothetical protein